ncbi:MAG: MBL fold metallo-hydrolase [Candidatus Buchananbacteria bacterium CG10_big_fil_rev_8_21_14_0_10_42_9]|uniref:MBL fold metallo-hydrolase n=1 Tax=Candidatus Buchananbacteria bacterium CG10_big_fil_rev_8_21_14_0_10_42_9 TaxID=1974526 RepID=A0A2H0W405_9BACT|nr:MAG: MBL fold metallo-hydrolase [Candidatus Buchananbacteria bacterium CG10_big_fil_rev_8_21_14_0_10_42_9]
MKNILITLILIAIASGLFFYYTKTQEEKPVVTHQQPDTAMPETQTQSDVKITPISHATMVLEWGGHVIYTDPVGGAEAFSGQPAPDFILITDIHGDHLDIDTLEDVVGDETTLVVPQAVADMLPATPGKRPEPLASRAVVMDNGDAFPQLDFTVTAIPMYNLPESDDAFHVKGRGNGYVVERNGTRVYIAGDTAGIPEMRNLKDIDIAFVPMNLPYTMDVEEAANAVLAFKPKQVYPYHYRTPDGFSDVDKFKELVNAGDPNIEVLLLNWYSES